MPIDDLNDFRDLVEHRIPFNAFLGVRVHSVEPGVCRLLMPFRDELLGDTRRGAIHGGVISMLVDTAGGCAVWSMCNMDDRIATIDLRVDYLKPAQNCDLIADASVKLLGNRVGNVHIQLYADGKPHRILAEGRAVYNIRRG
ncbi:MAG: PaaI family thioesterase [Desulfovibrionaceae bacterium]|jgi:uncharacterized protein (TIGR00369 family)|nr:PaaI family thioesterase [Desulfovibrionaceae bacterium]